MRRATWVVVACLVLVVAACGDDDDGAAAVESAPAGDGSIAWQPHSEDTETGTLTVPLDHDDPDGPTVELFVARRRAADPDQRIGTLLVNPGGPGVGGSDAALLADRSLGPALLDRFDIVGWDPRGTGRSTPAIDCVDDLDALNAATPDDAAQTFGAGCTSRSGDLLGHVGTNDSASDMDAIRQALGEDRISYLGFSYGSELGATWATSYPDTVRAAVLDGAADPTATFDERLVQRAAGFEAALGRYLAQCAADAGCAFHHDGDPATAFDALMAQLDTSPLPSAAGRPPITRGIAAQAVVQAMYSDGFWEQLSAALAAAESGDGAGLLALWDASLLRRPDGTWPDTFEAGQVITCMDRTERFDAGALDDVDARVAAVAPRLAAGLPSARLCSSLPAPERPREPITGIGAGPLLVIGTTGDPATPLASSQSMADTLADGRLVVVDANRHTGYRANECVDDVVHRYLVDLEVPPEETTC